MFLIFLFISVLLSNSSYSSFTTFTAHPLWWKTLCRSSSLWKDRRGLRSRVLGWLSVVLHASFSSVAHRCQLPPSVSRAVQSLPVPYCPLQSSCRAWGTSVCLKPQLLNGCKTRRMPRTEDWQELKILLHFEGCRLLLGLLNKCVGSMEFGFLLFRTLLLF